MENDNIQQVDAGNICLASCKVEEMKYPEVTEKENKSLFCEWLPARYIFASLGFLCLTLIFSAKTAISVTIVAMVDTPDAIPSSEQPDEAICSEVYKNETTNHTVLQRTNASHVGPTYDWDIRTQSIILGSFFYGYTVSQLPGGVISQYVGGKLALGTTLLASSIMTIAVPLVASWGAVPLIALRVLQGIVEGTTFPALNILISHWTPMKERTLILNFIYCGIYIGCAVGLLVGGTLSAAEFLGGWPSVFYVIGGFSLFLSVLWFFLVYERPSSHPRISASEFQMLRDLEDDASKASKVPWSSIVQSVPAWALNFSYLGYGWMMYFLMTEIPTYLDNMQHFDIRQNGLHSSAMYVVASVSSMLASCAASLLMQRSQLTVTTVRKIMNSIASFGSAGCAILVMVAGCHSTVVVVLIYLGNAMTAIAITGCEVVPVDMTPTYTAVLTGITNTIVNLAGCLAPYVTGEIIHSGQTAKNWATVFAVTASISIFCGVVFDIFGNAEVQPWDPISKGSKDSKTESKTASSASQQSTSFHK